MRSRAGMIAAVLGLTVLTPACSGQDTDGKTVSAASPAGGTLAATVSSSPDHRRLAGMLADAKLNTVLEGKAAYTVLAPSDTAFSALGARGEPLSQAEERPLLIAVLRGHILPGQITPAAIGEALTRKNGPVQMRTMAGTLVTFARAGEAITVSNGAQTATLGDSARTASNGALLPIDTVLLPPQ